MPNQQGAADTLDETFRLLADPTRRAVLSRLARGPATVSDLAAPFEMALPSFLQHLKALEAGGLVRTEKVGRVRQCALVPESLAPAAGWLETQRALWERRLDGLDALAVALEQERPRDR